MYQQLTVATNGIVRADVALTYVTGHSRTIRVLDPSVPAKNQRLTDDDGYATDGAAGKLYHRYQPPVLM